MSSFRRLVEQADRLTTRLQDFTGLDKPTVESVIQYAKQMVVEGNTGIDLVMFMSQMSRQFDITSPFLLQSMFESLKKPRATTVTIEEFSKCVCVFLCSKKDVKAEFAFRVYDIDHSGVIEKPELHILLKSCIVTPDTEFVDAETHDNTRDLMDLVMKLMDIDHNGLPLSDFKKMVKRDDMYLLMLGRCLPSEKAVSRFRSKIDGKNQFEVKALFASERLESLSMSVHKTCKKTDNLYPIQLDIP